LTHKKDFSDYLLEKKVDAEVSEGINNKLGKYRYVMYSNQTGDKPDRPKGVQTNK
jgi:hypothetical protein